MARLGGHVQVGVTRGQAGALVARDGAVDVALAPVVGGQRQVPVAEAPVQLLQVVQRRARGGQHVAPVVAKGVLLQVEGRAGGGHELPHAGGARAGHRLRIEGAFDEGQQRQLHGHAAHLDLLHDVEEVAAGALGHALDVVGPREVPLLVLAHEFVVQVVHGQAAADALPQVGGRGQRGHGGRVHWRHGELAQRHVAGQAHRRATDDGLVGGGHRRRGGDRTGGHRWGDGDGAGAAGQNRGKGQGQRQAPGPATQARQRRGNAGIHRKTFFHSRRVAKTATGSATRPGACC